MSADWFIADPDEAADVASIVCELHGFDDWPHLDLADLDDEAVGALWALLRADDSPAAELLFEDSDPEDGSVSVYRVHPELVRKLAGLKDAELRSLAKKWGAADSLSEWNTPGVEAVLKTMAAFARRAIFDGKAILAMAVA
ncbi:MAG: hypothetical protein MUF18_14545 [Fimbriiglobus sp.]|nr:hypothetical protein [Fimbriiglobus sp.]